MNGNNALVDRLDVYRQRAEQIDKQISDIIITRGRESEKLLKMIIEHHESLVHKLANLENNSDRVEQMREIQLEGLHLFERKNADYGDAFAEYGTIGVLMRIGDKIKRSLNITKNGVNLVDSESLEDTLLDLHNYAAMGLMLLREK